MDANEIIVQEMHRHRARVVVDLFAEALVNLVILLECIGTLRLFLSAYDVLICASSGLPWIGVLTAPVQTAGE